MRVLVLCGFGACAVVGCGEQAKDEPAAGAPAAARAGSGGMAGQGGAGSGGTGAGGRASGGVPAAPGGAGQGAGRAGMTTGGAPGAGGANGGRATASGGVPPSGGSGDAPGGAAGDGGDGERWMGTVDRCDGTGCPYGECDPIFGDDCAEVYPGPLTSASSLCASGNEGTYCMTVVNERVGNFAVGCAGGTATINDCGSFGCGIAGTDPAMCAGP